MDETIAIRDEAVLVLRCASNNHTMGVVVHSGLQGLSAEVKGDCLKQSAFGGPSHGEQDDRLVAERLLERFRADGEQWGPPVMKDRDARTEGGVDFISTSTSGTILSAQITRAQGDQQCWTALSRKGAFNDSRTVSDAALDLRRSIERKAHRMKAVQRGSLLLVLDASRTGAHGMQAVTDRFRTMHGSWASSLRFQAIWIVGLSSNLTFRLA